jgi:6-pyruvoyl-tetrahydropterin synthase
MGRYLMQVSRQIEAAHHNGPPDSKCRIVHGHSWHITVEIAYTEEDLDEYNWGVDFTKVKKIIDQFDHQDLNGLMTDPPSAEHIARVIAQLVKGATGFMPDRVIVEEGKGNIMTFFPDRP